MNNNTINGPEYYRLEDGTYLEDALWDYCTQIFMLSGPEWDAIVYLHRAGKKDGEPWHKDIKKFRHCCKFLACKSHRYRFERYHVKFLVGVLRWIRSKHRKASK